MIRRDFLFGEKRGPESAGSVQTSNEVVNKPAVRLTRKQALEF